MPTINHMPRHTNWDLNQQLLRETAFHEAGHAVLAKLSGTRLVGNIDARPGAKEGAFDCVFRADLHHARSLELGVKVDTVAESAVISAAGAVAQTRFMIANAIGVDVNGKLTSLAEEYVFHCASGDVQDVQRNLGPGQWVNQMEAASRLFDDVRVWRAVEILAAEVILRNGDMRKDSVDAVLHNAFIQLGLPQFQALI